MPIGQLNEQVPHWTHSSASGTTCASDRAPCLEKTGFRGDPEATEIGTAAAGGSGASGTSSMTGMVEKSFLTEAAGFHFDLPTGWTRSQGPRSPRSASALSSRDDTGPIVSDPRR